MKNQEQTTNLNLLQEDKLKEAIALLKMAFETDKISANNEAEIVFLDI